MKKYDNKKIVWHQYRKEEDLFDAYNKTNYFLLPIDSVARQKYILPVNFQATFFFVGQ